jgi:hypothetical protein
MSNINIAIRLSSLSAEIRKVLQPQENGRELLVKSPVRDSLVNNIAAGPHPKSLSLWERDFESSSLLPLGEGLGM